MYIGIDAYEANTQKRVGIGQYAYQLLVELYQTDNKNSYRLFLPDKPLSDLPPSRSNWSYIVGTPGKFWTIHQLPQLLKNTPVDLFFSLTHYIPWFTNIPKIFSIMDLSYIHYPWMFNIKDYFQLRYMTHHSVMHAQKIVTISQFCKSEIIKFYSFPENDIIVIYPGLSKLPNLSPHEMRVFFDKYDISKKYILFVGTIQPRKNIVRLIEAYNKLNKDIQLVVVGKLGWKYKPILNAMNTSSKRDQILILDYVSSPQLRLLYEHAECFVLPSLYEGFGIPVLEAIQYGCPIVVSKRSSLPEVAGEAGIYIDPENSDDIAHGLEIALQLNPEEKNVLIKKGREHIKKFSWKLNGNQLLNLFNTFVY